MFHKISVFQIIGLFGKHFGGGDVRRDRSIADRPITGKDLINNRVPWYYRFLIFIIFLETNGSCEKGVIKSDSYRVGGGHSVNTSINSRITTSPTTGPEPKIYPSGEPDVVGRLNAVSDDGSDVWLWDSRGTEAATMATSFGTYWAIASPKKSSRNYDNAPGPPLTTMSI